MTKEEYLKQILEKLRETQTREKIRKIITEADNTLEESNFTKTARLEFFDGLIKEAQENVATMNNAVEAQKIINALLTPDE